jgi:hypothetical protein
VYSWLKTGSYTIFDTKKIMEASGLVENAVICSVGKEAIEYMAAANLAVNDFYNTFYQ